MRSDAVERIVGIEEDVGVGMVIRAVAGDEDETMSRDASGRGSRSSCINCRKTRSRSSSW